MIAALIAPCVMAATAMTVPAEIIPRGNGQWAIVPAVVPPGGLDAVEMRFAAHESHEVRLHLRTVSSAALDTIVADYLCVEIPGRLSQDTVTVISASAPVQAAFSGPMNGASTPRTTWLGKPLWAYRDGSLAREPPDSTRGLLWRFAEATRNGEWRVLGTWRDGGDSTLIMESPGTSRIETSPRWGGLDASSHPVLVIQLRVHSGVGSTTLSWTTEEGVEGELTARVHPLAWWSQVVFPLYLQHAWRGKIVSLSLRPIDHPARVAIDWISLPRLSGMWATLLESSTARWLGIGILTLVCFTAYRFGGLTSPVALLGAMPTASICGLLLLPFPELWPGVSTARFSVPWVFLVVFCASLARLRRSAPWSERAAWLCAAATIGHGCTVAGGAGLHTAMLLSMAPLAYVAGSLLARVDAARVGMAILATVVVGCSLHAALWPVPAGDPLCGSLLSTLGRSYWDPTVGGRAGGSFVHPLVLAAISAVTGVSLLAFSSRDALLKGLGLMIIILGFAAMSRTYLLLAVLTLLWLSRRRRALLILTGVLLITIVAVSRGSQGMNRDLHLGKRIVGVQVAARTLLARPLQGVGWGRYERAVRRFGPPITRTRPFTTPDNSYARLLAEGGITAGGLWLAWLLILVGATSRMRRTSWIPPAFAVACLLAMWGVFDGAYWPAASALPTFVVGMLTGTHHAR